jgi:hypothetical protein
MADTILSGTIQVNYLDDNRRKQLSWIGAATGTQTMNEVYSGMASLLDEAATGDDATCMTAETPVEYTIGIIDANDADPWYINYEAVQHLTGGALRTAGWTRVVGTAVGIVVTPVNTGGAIVPADAGLTITHAAGDSGTLLEVLVPTSGGTEYLVIRPATSAAGDSFDSTSGNLTCNAHVAVQNAAAGTGEQVWANLYNVTPIDADTHVYMYQGLVSTGARARITEINDGNNANSQDWWPEGAFDRCIPLHDITSATLALIDSAYITVFARKGNTLYDSFEVLASSVAGGRNPVPLSAAADSNQTTGYQSITFTAGSGSWNVGDQITGDTSGASAIITLIANAGATQTLHYYLIGDPQITFQTAAEGITNDDTAATGTKNGSAPANQGPALTTWFTNNAFPSLTYTATTYDVADEGTAEGYGITLDVNSNTLQETYEWGKYITRNGGKTTGNTDAIAGEQYVGPTVYLFYGTSPVSGGTIAEGDDVLQETSGATGIVVSHDTTLNQILLRDVRGTFITGSATSATVTSQDAGAGSIEMETADSASVGTFNANKQSPFGTLAGGRTFFARGIVPTNWLAAEENSWEAIPSAGGAAQARPIAITISVSNVFGTAITDATADHVTVHRLTGLAGAIDKEEYSAVGGEVMGDATLAVDGSILADVPGKQAGGMLNFRDADNNNEHYKIRYSSWLGSTFTFANTASTATAGTTTTQITDSGGAFNTTAKRGDIVVNTQGGGAGRGYAYVETVDSNTQLTLDRVITGQVSTDSYELNCIPGVTINTLDDVYLSVIDDYPTATTSSVNIVYTSPIFYRVKVSNTRASTKIKRFVTDGSATGSDVNTATIRNTDTIHS